ncbi:beta-1,4-N-acetylgalactosaminyltransferase 3-like [Salminus brasiliensis]|uniref:beta-1,4-N-acetylgalactosaminyltransferase 3-like n=1 Tax=Salminus brasiliensis TaxID=930266 RepID=UPI003B82D57C
MGQLSVCLTGLFTYRQLKSCALLMVLGVLMLIIYLAFFTVHAKQRKFPDTAEEVKLTQHLSKLYPWVSVLRGDQGQGLTPAKDKAPTLSKHGFKEKAEQEQPAWKPEYRGKVNMHVFEDWCGGSTEQLRKNVLYPLFPHTRTTLSKLATYPKWENYGLRIFGYIHPASSGQHIFVISSDKNSEFWLSPNEKPSNLRLLAYVGKTGDEWSSPGEYRKFASQITHPITLLENEKYFFEILFKHSQGIDHLEVAWRQNQKNSSFAVISSEFLSLYTNESSLVMGDITHIPQTEASHEIHLDHISRSAKPEVDMVREDPRDSIYKIPLMNASYLRNVFPECDYKPITVFRGDTIKRYHGIYHVHYSAVYPNDYTRQTHSAVDEMCFYNKVQEYIKGGVLVPNLETESEKQEADPYWQRVFNVKSMDLHSKQPVLVTKVCRRAGNVIMDEKEVMPVVEAFMNQLQTEQNSSDLVLKRVLNVERRVDSEVGTRYLLELELEDGQAQNMLLSRYFFVEKTTSKQGSPVSVHMPALCSPRDFSWNPTVKVNVILTVKNQGKWIIQFIRQMENIYKTTGDKNFNIIIVDYSSDDLDIETALKTAKLPSYQYKRLEGVFRKTGALQTAIDLSKDEDSILFLCDLHLNFPTSIIHTVRKHTVQGKMVFAPVVMRLDCGSSAHAPTGFWEIDGYGMIGIYKSDMNRIGGMNTEDFKDKWGGEDWELLDRIVVNKLEVERLNLRNFLHYFHSKRGMWNN